MKRNVALALASLFLFSGAQRAAAECSADELSLKWPMGGTDGVDWVINNYVDLQAGAGMQDYRGNTGEFAKTYEGHNGIDIDVPDLRQMDAGVPVYASADGVVVDVQSDLFDRNMEAPAGCGAWNHVTLKHANGFTTSYGHLRQNSTIVTPGQHVLAGQILGLIGSSGCSSTAHLHFMVQNCENVVLEPFAEAMFANPPVYETALRVMDMTVRKGGFPEPASFHPSDALMKDPPRNIASIAAGSRIGIGLSVAGGANGDKLEVRLHRPNGNVYSAFSPIVFSTPARHSWPRWWVDMPARIETGNWTVEVRANGRLVRTHTFQMQPTSEAVTQGVATQTYEHTFRSLADAQYTAVWVDGNAQPGEGARMSSIYRFRNGSSRTEHDLDAASYQRAFNEATAAGLQLNSVDNYIKNGEVRIAAVFSQPWGGAWQAYHMVTRQDHQTRFNNLRAQGYRPYAISVVILNGREYISAAYTASPSRGWSAVAGLTSAEYQAEFNRQVQAGRGLIYIDGYDDNGTTRFSAIWSAEGGSRGWFGRHDLDEATFFQFNEERAMAGMPVRVITSYLTNGRRLYAGVWSNDR